MGMDERHEALVAGSRNREREVTMTTAIIGVGDIGGRLARDLVRGGVPVVLAAKDEAHGFRLP